jgi:hypothetical protein
MSEVQLMNVIVIVKWQACDGKSENTIAWWWEWECECEVLIKT